METNEYQERNFKALTPSIALSYLKFKQAYEDKNYIAVWDAIIPRYFTEASFCGHINSLREKRIEIANMGKEESKKAFAIAFDSLLWDKIKDKQIDAQEFKQLVGSLMSVYTSPKFKHFTQNYTQDIVHVLDQIHTEKDTKSQKKQEKIDKKNQKNGEANQKMENKMEQEGVIHKELFTLYMTTKQNFLDAKEVGYILSHEDNDTIFHIARNQFLEENTVAKKQSDRIYDEFYQRFIY